MIKKFYEYIKDFILENYLYLLFLLITVTTLTYPLPYYIYTKGGLINVDNKIDFKGKTSSSGSYNLCYVSEIKATIPTYLLSFIMSDWVVVASEELTVSESETDSDVRTRDKIYMDTGNISALLTAFTYANKPLEIITTHPITVYVLEDSNTDIKIGDEILSIDGVSINNVEDISDVIKDKDVGDKVSVKVLNNNKEYLRYSYITLFKEKKVLGISIENKKEIVTDPEINFKFSRSESGPSGGLILSLALYDYLVSEDVTKGLKISGTGTIDDDGIVGSIGGVKYKLAGAVSKKSDIFFVPNGENYEEAIKLKKEKKYKIEIVGVDTFLDAINYLKEM